MANLKNINDLPVAESAEGLNLIANDNGAAKQIPAEFIGKVKTVNGASPDENGNVEVEIPEGFSGSWNDLKDKPFYEEIADITLFDGVVISNEALYFDEPLEIESERTYLIIFDGVEYNTFGQEDDLDGKHISLPLGNIHVYIYSSNISIYGDLENVEHTIKVIAPNVSTIKTIDVEFIPEEAIVRTDIEQSLTDNEKQKARRNIGAVATEHVPTSVWIADSVSTYSSYDTYGYRVDLINADRFKPGKAGTIILVPGMKSFGFRSNNGYELSVYVNGRERMSDHVYNLKHELLKDDRHISYYQAHGPNLFRLGAFFYTGEYWLCIPLAHPGNDIDYGYVCLSDSIDKKLDSTCSVAATPKAVKIAYDKAMEVENKAVLKDAKEFTLTSSTAGSTKKFKITVDDSGTLTATEVTE